MSTAGTGIGRPDRTKVTLEVIARTLGVSTATVSLALRNNPVVAEATKKHVQRVARELGYVYNRSAAALRTSRTNTVGVAFHDIRNPYFAEMLAELVDSVADAGRSLLLGSCGDDLDRQNQVLESLKEHRPDGIIVCPVAGSSGDSLNHLLAAGIPLVQVARQVEGLDADFVGADGYKGAILALDHLFELGHRRIALIGGDPRTSTSEARIAAFRDAYERWGLALDEDLLRLGGSELSIGEAAIRHWVEENNRPTALLCANASIAFGAMVEARRQGIDIPAQLSIVGTDDVQVAEIMNPGLTSISTNHEQIARHAAAIMMRRIDDPEMERISMVLAPELIVRGSSGRVPQ
jgi:LacI family transcriptional regulator